VFGNVPGGNTIGMLLEFRLDLLGGEPTTEQVPNHRMEHLAAIGTVRSAVLDDFLYLIEGVLAPIVPRGTSAAGLRRRLVQLGPGRRAGDQRIDVDQLLVEYADLQPGDGEDLSGSAEDLELRVLAAPNRKSRSARPQTRRPHPLGEISTYAPG
jgi:hypothetical protein